jgi:hypothetical protein
MDKTGVLDLPTLANVVRAEMSKCLSICSDQAFADVLDQVRDYPQESGDETVVMEMLLRALTAAVVEAARCEVSRRADSIADR